MNRSLFFAAIRQTLFRGRLSQAQVDGMNGILDAWAAHGSGVDRQLAYVLATAYHETGGHMAPVREGFAKSDRQARRVVAGRRYGKPAGPYGHVYYGRGHVQLTWHKNYVASSDDAGVDLQRNPDAMLDPVISARILVKGMLDGRWNGRGKGLGAYITASRADYQNARRTVNITDKWRLIEGYARSFEAALKEAGRGGAREGIETAPTTGKHPLASTTNLSAAGGFIATAAMASEDAKALIGNASETFGISPAWILLAVAAGCALWIFRERIRKAVQYGI